MSLLLVHTFCAGILSQTFINSIIDRERVSSAFPSLATTAFLPNSLACKHRKKHKIYIGQNKEISDYNWGKFLIS